ncbi:hypothetical protein [Streptomyces sp. NPDC093600]|uniref:hypothetical protein n=1 Tax=Streptomyces sp. NPDC093600 TaxID=3366047 RepID=UPI00382D6F79
MLRRVPARLLSPIGLALFAVAAAARALPHDGVVPAASALIGLGLPWVLVAAMTAVQREAPPGAVGRTAATAHTLVFVPNAAALAVGAGLIAVVDIRTLLPVLGALGLAGAVTLAAPGGGAAGSGGRSPAPAGPATGDRPAP